jgi:isopropylmalate/homocitrate/citramalate synthase
LYLGVFTLIQPNTVDLRPKLRYETNTQIHSKYIPNTLQIHSRYTPNTAYPRRDVVGKRSGIHTDTCQIHANTVKRIAIH